MTMSATAVRRGLFGAFATCALGGVVAATIAIPTAGAQPDCTASGFTHVASGVLNSAGGWLDTHPEANEVLTAAGMQGSGAEMSVRDYFVAHPQDYQELRGIAAPLIDMQHGCGAAIQPDADRRAVPGAVPVGRADVTLHAAVATPHEAVRAEGRDTKRGHDE